MKSTAQPIETLVENTQRHLHEGLATLEAGAEPPTILLHVWCARRSLHELECIIRREERTRIMQRAREQLARATTDGERARIMAQAVERVLKTMTPDERAALLGATRPESATIGRR